MQKINPSSWEKFSKQIQMGKQTVQQLSKLYIIIHQKVKLSIKNSIINNNAYNFPQEAQHHIEFIKKILIRIRQAKNDEYLIEVQQKMLQKYQRSLLALLQQIDINLNVQENKLNLNFQNLKRIKPVQPKQFDLHDQIMKSTTRMIRSKSGKRKVKNIQQKQPGLLNLTNQSNKNSSSFLINNNKAYQMKLKIQEDVKKHIEIDKTSVSFAKKYKNDNLQKYLTLRKQFADLILMNQRVDTNHHNIQNQQKQSQLLIKNKNAQIKNKLFPQFQIKTKFMKPKVKQNIMETIAEVKVKLLQDYCNQNINKIKEANQGGLINLEMKKTNKPNKVYKSFSTSKLETKFRSKQKNYSSHKKQTFQLKGTNYTQKKLKQINSEMNQLASKTDTKRKSSNLFGKSYQSQRWSDEVNKITQNQLQKKLINNKLSSFS